jgi:hypothetical protein
MSPASRSTASEHTPDSKLPTKDWPFNTSSALFNDELSRSPTQQSHEAPVSALLPTSRLICSIDGFSVRVCSLTHILTVFHYLSAVATPYALTQLDGAPILCISSQHWPFAEQVGDLKPKCSVWMPDSEILLLVFDLQGVLWSKMLECFHSFITLRSTLPSRLTQSNGSMIGLETLI